MIDKLKWAYKLLRSNTYVVLTDKDSVVNIPLTKLDTFENIFLVSAQAASLKDFKNRLEGVIKEHGEVINHLAREKKTPRKKSVR